MPISGSATFTTVTSSTSISCAQARTARATQRDGTMGALPLLPEVRGTVDVMANPPLRDNLNYHVRVIGSTLTHKRLFKKGISGMAAPRAQRADARRNIAAILDAATDCLARDPEMSIAGIAAAAGAGRITLYGHFKTRADPIDAVLARTGERADATLDAPPPPAGPGR